MKNIVNKIIVVFFLFFGMNFIYAQGLEVSNDRPEAIAKQQVALIVEQIELTGDQQRALFRAYVKREVGIKKIAMAKDMDESTQLEHLQELDKVLEKAVEKELSAEQFEKWKNIFLK